MPRLVESFRCMYCSFEIPVAKNWRRDLRLHYETKHKTDKGYLSANNIKVNHFIRVTKLV